MRELRFRPDWAIGACNSLSGKGVLASSVLTRLIGSVYTEILERVRNLLRPFFDVTKMVSAKVCTLGEYGAHVRALSVSHLDLIQASIAENHGTRVEKGHGGSTDSQSPRPLSEHSGSTAFSEQSEYCVGLPGIGTPLDGGRALVRLPVTQEFIRVGSEFKIKFKKMRI